MNTIKKFNDLGFKITIDIGATKDPVFISLEKN